MFAGGRAVSPCIGLKSEESKNFKLKIETSPFTSLYLSR